MCQVSRQGFSLKWSSIYRLARSHRHVAAADVVMTSNRSASYRAANLLRTSVRKNFHSCRRRRRLFSCPKQPISTTALRDFHKLQSGGVRVYTAPSRTWTIATAMRCGERERGGRGEREERRATEGMVAKRELKPVTENIPWR